MAKMKRVLLMLPEGGGSQDRIAAILHVSKRDVSEASKTIKEHSLTYEAILGMDPIAVEDTGTVKNLSQKQLTPYVATGPASGRLRLGAHLLILEKRHIQIAAPAPLALGDVLGPGGHQHQGGTVVGEGADHPRPAPDLTVEPLDGVVRADPGPVLHREVGVGQRLKVTLAHDLRRGPEPHAPEAGGHFARLGDGGLPRLLGVYGPRVFANVGVDGTLSRFSTLRSWAC